MPLWWAGIAVDLWKEVILIWSLWHSVWDFALTSQQWKVKMLVTQSGLTLCDPMDYSPPGSSVHGISQARILDWVAFTSPGDLSDPGIKPGSLYCRQILYHLSHQVSLLMRIKEESKKLTWNSTFRKLRSWHLVSSLHGKYKGKSGNSDRFCFLGLQITVIVADGLSSHGSQALGHMAQ